MATGKIKLQAPANHMVNISLGIILLFLMVWILILGKTIILPFMIAIFLSILLDPIVSLLIRLKIPLSIAVTLTLLLAFIFLYLIGLLVYANVETFINQLPVYQDRLLSWLAAITTRIELLIGQPLNLKNIKIGEWLGPLQGFSFAKGIFSSVGTFVSFFLNMLIIIIFIAYLLTGKRSINRKIEQAFPESQSRRIIAILDNVNTQVQIYLGVKTIISLITGLGSIAIFIAFGLEYAAFWGFLIFLFNYIPNIGSIVASLLPTLFSLIQFGSPIRALWLIVALTILQFTMGNIVEPRYMGRSLNLSPLVVILSLIFWGYIWGITGMILAVPILGTMTIIFENFESLKFISVFIRGNPKPEKTKK